MKIVNRPAYGGEVLERDNGDMVFNITTRGVTLTKKWVAHRYKPVDGVTTYAVNFFEARPNTIYELKVRMDFDAAIIQLIKDWGI